MNVLKLLGLGALLVVLGTARADDKVDYAKLIVGKWEVAKADPRIVIASAPNPQ